MKEWVQPNDPRLILLPRVKLLALLPRPTLDIQTNEMSVKTDADLSRRNVLRSTLLIPFQGAAGITSLIATSLNKTPKLSLTMMHCCSFATKSNVCQTLRV